MKRNNGERRKVAAKKKMTWREREESDNEILVSIIGVKKISLLCNIRRIQCNG